jgi:hypothetical protein
LPDDGGWLPVARWRRAFNAPGGRRTAGTAAKAAPMALVQQVESVLKERQLIDVRQGKVRRRGYHFVAQSVDERRSLALEFCALFVKGLLDKLVLPHVETGTYLRNHYLYVDPGQVPEIQQRIDQALTAIADEFAKGPSPERRFLNILITSTPL